MNHQVNVREAGGYNTLHAGSDVLFCEDRQYIGVDLKYGPDGAVYISDWYDPRHCHNPNVEHWDRGNGRMYRMKFDAGYQPVTVDDTVATDEELVEAQLHPNDWHVRMARLALGERAAKRPISDEAASRLRALATEHEDPARRLRGLWALHAIGALGSGLTATLLEDASEYVRAWTVQLAVESLETDQYAPLLVRLVERERSLYVRRYLASALQRVPDDVGWLLAEALSQQPENALDRELPQLLWYGLAALMERDLHRALALADTTDVGVLRDYIHWYAAKLSEEGRNVIASRLADVDAAERLRLLSLFALGVSGMRGVAEPEGWSAVSASLYESPDPNLRRAAETLGATFADEALFAHMRDRLTSESATKADKQRALSILAGDASTENLSHYLRLLDTGAFTLQVLPLMSRYRDPAVAEAVLTRLPAWKGETSDVAMEVLCSRPEWAESVLDSIAAGKLEKSRLTAYFARQMASLGSESLKDRLAREWGRFGPSSADLKQEIAKTVATFESAPLWAYSAQAGAAHFKKLCANCHQPNQQNESIAPSLAGTGSKGIEYIVENVVDPNAVIGRDFLARVIVTSDGRVTSGLIDKETDSALTVRTATGSVIIAREDIEVTAVSENSFMPTDLLKTLNERERIELFKYLMTQ
jgi:putative heme-binding domain-containing protein